MKHDNHGCARMVWGGGFGCLTLLASFFLLFYAGFRAVPAEAPPVPEAETTLIVHEPGSEGWETVETTSDGVALTTRSFHRDGEELRLVWNTNGEVEPELSGAFDTGGERLRGLTDAEVLELEGWRR